MSILTEKLPDTVFVDGIRYPIRTDFRVWINFEKIMFDKETDFVKRLTAAIDSCMDKERGKLLPGNITELLKQLSLFHCCNKKTETSSGESEPAKKSVFDIEEDAPYIYAAFLAQYGVDLIDIPYLHWFKFDAMLRSLEDSNKIIKIAGWRGMDISKIKDSEQRKIYRDLQNSYALPDKRTMQERDADNAAELAKMFF